MSDEKSLSNRDRVDDLTAVGPVTVRVTESSTDELSTVSALHDTDATVEFPSFAAAKRFADRLTEASDDHEFLLTPDHRTDATFFLRCQDAEALD
jgi:hypothetical protein